MWEYWDSHLRVPGQNAIWMWPLWRGVENTIKVKVVASPKSGPLWILWVRVCPWLILAPKMLKPCTNQFVFGLCIFMWVIKCLSFFLVLFWSSSMPFYPQSVASQGACPDSLFIHCSHFIFTFESIKEFGGVSLGWGVGRMTSKSITLTDLHKPNKLLIT
jgi:hypothetical protein